jgi:peptidoglycan hydrolase CwlO-like protein
MEFQLKSIEPKIALAAGLALVVLSAGVTWTVQHGRIGRLQQALDSYEQGRTTELAKVLEDVRNASDVLGKQAGELQKIDALKRQNTDLQQALGNAQKEIADLRAQIKSARSERKPAAAPAKPQGRHR